MSAGARTAAAMISTPRAHALSGLLLRPSQPNAVEDDDTENKAKLATAAVSWYIM